MNEAIEVIDGMKERWEAAARQAGNVVLPCKYQIECNEASKMLEKRFGHAVGWLQITQGIGRLINEIECRKFGASAIRRGEKALMNDLLEARIKDDAKSELLWQMARLIRNTDNLNPYTFAQMGMNYLIELQKLCPEEYELKVKGGNEHTRTNESFA